jgi:hypothetical protein
VSFIRHQLRAWTWAALLAVLALALLPTVSRAWGLGAEPVGVHAMVEVCTTDGLRMVPNADGQASTDTSAHHADAFERCAHCVLGAAPLVLPPIALVGYTADPRAQALPALFWQAPHTLHVWAAAQPRAPPVHS